MFEFRVSLLVNLFLYKDPILPYCLSIAVVRIIGCIQLLNVFELCEMQTTSFKLELRSPWPLCTMMTVIHRGLLIMVIIALFLPLRLTVKSELRLCPPALSAVYTLNVESFSKVWRVIKLCNHKTYQPLRIFSLYSVAQRSLPI